ncbi:hypothetical protein, partial [Arthrobacter sp. 4R501]|uniref:hypothetical protein n=1 Tax=Arthrobacter sp. 4R501 TaxID=2058886 RepID=UPI001CA4DE19
MCLKFAGRRTADGGGLIAVVRAFDCSVTAVLGAHKGVYGAVDGPTSDAVPSAAAAAGKDGCGAVQRGLVGGARRQA